MSPMYLLTTQIYTFQPTSRSHASLWPYSVCVLSLVAAKPCLATATPFYMFPTHQMALDLPAEVGTPRFDSGMWLRPPQSTPAAATVTMSCAPHGPPMACDSPVPTKRERSVYGTQTQARRWAHPSQGISNGSLV
jgi:hypothetical protein